MATALALAASAAYWRLLASIVFKDDIFLKVYRVMPASIAICSKVCKCFGSIIYTALIVLTEATKSVRA